MQKNMQNKDIRTLGYVLRRVNYGEADRILNVLTAEGKISVIAKGVRREKSKLAGNIEMFTLVDFNFHKGKGEFGVVTSAKMVKYYSEIVKDLNKIEVASMILKNINKITENSDSKEYFKILDQSLEAINDGVDLELVNTWFLLNLKKAMGEEINFYRDTNGEKLKEDRKYDWDVVEMAFTENMNGEYGADEIKLLRLMVSSDLDVIRRVKFKDSMILVVLRLVRMVV